LNGRSEAIASPARPAPGSLGILGGTFDPIHHGHLAIAEDAREVLGLERVLFVPAGLPPHKRERPVTPAGHRLAMVELAIAGNPCFAASRIEVDRDGPSYTADTLEAMHAAGGRDLWFILSGEALAGLPAWHRPARVLELARLAVVPRGGVAAPDPAWIEQHFPGRADRFTFLSGPLLPISGSVVRRRVAAGRSIRYLVPDPVARYIAEHQLYRELTGGS
jgi:nicotinate-nucleotide adenylyltransferase